MLHIIITIIFTSIIVITSIIIAIITIYFQVTVKSGQNIMDLVDKSDKPEICAIT